MTKHVLVGHREIEEAIRQAGGDNWLVFVRDEAIQNGFAIEFTDEYVILRVPVRCLP